MENLEVLEYKRVDLPYHIAAVFTGYEGEKYFVTEDFKLYREVMMQTPLGGQNFSILAAHMHPFENNILVALSTGDILLLQKQGDGVMFGDVIGSFLDGLDAASVSPDDEILLLVTRKIHKVILMSRNSFEIILERSLDEFKQSVHNGAVSVGWGKKETQFHGSAGKQAALAKVVIEERLLEDDDGCSQVSWRTDGEYFAVSFVHQGLHREILVFSKDGTCQAVKEPTEGLGNLIAWRSDNSLIATVQRVSSSERAIFFERNGLRHGEFDLRLPCGVMPVKVIWNTDGSIFSVVRSDGFIDFWICSNYHWYLKASLPLEAQNITWMSKMSCVISSRSTAIHIRFGKGVSRTSGDDSDNFSMVAVVDGLKLLLTPLAMANVPPPFSYDSIQFEVVPSAIALQSQNSVVIIAVAFANGTVACFEYDPKAKTHKKLKSHQAESGNFIRRMTFSESIVQCLTNDGKLAAWTDDSFQIRDDADCLDDLICIPPNDLADPHECRSNDEVLFDRNSGITLYLSKDGVLTADGIQISEHCRSFALHPSFLCTSDSRGLVRFYPLSLPVQEWSKIKSSDSEENARLSEDGAIIIAVSSKKASLVLQMPRGNLETVYPRAFVLDQVRKQLNNLSYREAFLNCRRHRLDLNFIHDNNPELFMSTMNKFIDQVPEVDYLNLFMSGLRDEDVSITRYSLHGSKGKASSVEGKVNRICDRMKELLVAEPMKYAECIMTAMVCHQPPNHEGALKTLIGLTSPHAMEKALKYLIFLVPAERLYKVALGMYHLSLAFSIAKRSTMDPSEYVEFLNGLYAITNLPRRHFKIDDHLGRYFLALNHLTMDKESTPEMIIEYVERHGLYAHAMSLYEESDVEFWKRICQAYGRRLMAEGDPSSATDLFVFADAREEAIDAAIQSGKWQTLLSLDPPQSAIDEAIDHLIESKQVISAVRLAELTCAPERCLKVAINGTLWMDAWRIAHSKALSTDLLLDCAHEYYDHLMADLQQIKSTLKEKGDRFIVLQSQLNDLLEPGKIVAALEGDTSALAVFGSTEEEINDAMSMLSFRSRATNLTSITGISRSSTAKSKKKAERQKMKGKQGSPFEREYLRDVIKEAIGNFTIRVNESADLFQLLSVAGKFNMIREGQQIINEMASSMSSFSQLARRLVSTHEERLQPETIAALGLTPASIPETIIIDHWWKVAFDLPPQFPKDPLVKYVL